MNRLIVYLVTLIVITAVSVIAFFLNASILLTIILAGILGGASIAITERAIGKKTAEKAAGRAQPA